MRQHLAVCIFFLLIVRSLGNTEKTVFAGPAAVVLPPTLWNLHTQLLSPDHPILRTRLSLGPLPASTAEDQVTESWYHLHELTVGQSYEVRVCWAATVSILDGTYIDEHSYLLEHNP